MCLVLVGKLLSSLFMELKHTSGSHHPPNLSTSLAISSSSASKRFHHRSVRRCTESKNSILRFIFIGFVPTVKRHFLGAYGRGDVILNLAFQIHRSQTLLTLLELPFAEVRNRTSRTHPKMNRHASFHFVGSLRTLCNSV